MAERPPKRETRRRLPVARLLDQALELDLPLAEDRVSSFLERHDAQTFIHLVERYYVTIGDGRWENSGAAVGSKENYAPIPAGAGLNIAYIPMRQKRNFMTDWYDRIRSAAQNQDLDAESTSKALYLLTNYTHPLPEGNGRLARALYTGLSPKIVNAEEAVLQAIGSGTGAKTEAYNEIHNDAMKQMLAARELAVPQDIENNGSEMVTTVHDRVQYGFDKRHLAFFYIYDVLSPQQREAVIQTDPSGGWSVDIDDMVESDELTDKLFSIQGQDMEAVRVEFITAIMTRATTEPQFGDSLFAEIRTAVGQTAQ